MNIVPGSRIGEYQLGTRLDEVDPERLQAFDSYVDPDGQFIQFFSTVCDDLELRLRFEDGELDEVSIFEGGMLEDDFKIFDVDLESVLARLGDGDVDGPIEFEDGSILTYHYYWSAGLVLVHDEDGLIDHVSVQPPIA